MSSYRPEGFVAFTELAVALAEEQVIAHELAHCAKVDVYHQLAADIYGRLQAARARTRIAYDRIEQFKT